MKTKQKPTKTRIKPLKVKQVKFIEEFIKNMGHITDACKEIGINRATYYDWMQTEKFKEAFNDAMEHFHDSVQRRILRLAMKDNERMLMFWAKNQMKHRGWVEKSEVEVTGSDSIDFVKALAQKYDEHIKSIGASPK